MVQRCEALHREGNIVVPCTFAREGCMKGSAAWIASEPHTIQARFCRWQLGQVLCTVGGDLCVMGGACRRVMRASAL